MKAREYDIIQRSNAVHVHCDGNRVINEQTGHLWHCIMWLSLVNDTC